MMSLLQHVASHGSLTLIYMLKLTIILSLKIRFDKTHENLKILCQKTAKRMSNKQGNKRTLNDFVRTFGTIGSTERTAVSCFCVSFITRM